MLCTASDTFRILACSALCLFRSMPTYSIIFSINKTHSRISRLIQAYSVPCVALAYSQPCHSLSPGIFRTASLFKNLSNVEQAYSDPCHSALSAIFRHIQNLVKRLYMQKLWIFWLPQSHEKKIVSTENMILLPCIFDKALLGLIVLNQDNKYFK